MDSVLNCLKLKQLSSSFDYKFFSDDIVRKYLLLEKYVKFEDYRVASSIAEGWLVCICQLK